MKRNLFLRCFNNGSLAVDLLTGCSSVATRAKRNITSPIRCGIVDILVGKTGKIKLHVPVGHYVLMKTNDG